MHRMWIPSLSMIAFGLLTVGCGPPIRTYEARVVLELSPPPKDQYPGNFQGSMVAQFHSRSMLDAALKDPNAAGIVIGKAATFKESDAIVNVKDKAIEWLEGRIYVDGSRPNFLVVRMTGNDPEEPLILLKAVVHAYVAEVAKAYKVPVARVVEEVAVRQLN